MQGGYSGNLWYCSSVNNKNSPYSLLDHVSIDKKKSKAQKTKQIKERCVIYPNGWDNGSAACLSFCEEIEHFKELYSSGYISETESEILASKLIIFLISYWQRNAIARYNKINYLSRYYSRIVNDEYFIVYVYRKFSNNTNHKFWNSDTENYLLKNAKTLVSLRSAIAYKKVWLLRKCLFEKTQTSNIDKRALSEFLRALRLFFLVKEINHFCDFLKVDMYLATSYFAKLYSKINIAYVEIELESYLRKSLKKYAHSLLFYYPAFVREIVESFINYDGRMSAFLKSIDFSLIQEEAKEYFDSIRDSILRRIYS